VRCKTPVLLGIALVVVALGWSPTLASAAGGSALTAPPSPPTNLLAEIKKPSAGRGSGGGTIQQPKTNVGCTVLFTQVASPNATTFNQLVQAAAISPTDMWAVGFSNTGASNNTPDQNLAEHWNGTNWSVVATPNVGPGFNDLAGVAVNDSNDVWAVGNSQGTFFNNLAMHWNGSSWAVVATPQPSASNQFLSGVSSLATNSVWAAGAYDNGSGILQNLVLHWDGMSWSSTLPPNAGSGDNILQTIYARTPSDIWVVGQYLASAAAHSTTSNPWLTLIEHYNGTAWSVVTSTNPVAGDNALFNVSAISGTDAWAVGATQTTALLSQTLAEHWNGTAWSTVASPNIGTGDNFLFGILTLSPTNAWITGFGRMTSTSGGSSLAAHWDGSAWTQETADNPGPSGQALSGLAALPGNDVLAVGDYFPSNSSELTMVQQFQLPPPTAVTAATAGDQAATVSWTAPACNGGFTTTGYEVTAWDGCGPQMTLPAASSPFTFPGVTNGSPFTFTVQAVSASLGAETASAPSAAVVPVGTTVPAALSACSSKQYSYSSPDPTNFVDIDSTNLKLTVSPTADSIAIITANVDLWTANAGLNQDIGINVSGGTFSTGQVVAWKESGGFAGTFSPNAAAVQAEVTLPASSTYTVKLQWKGNKAFPGALIVAGAGPLPGAGLAFSPTRLSMRLVPVSATSVKTASTSKQYGLSGNNGTTWVDLDSALSVTVSPSATSYAVITGNVDLWTANAGFNQDIGINVDGSIAAWKESGGFAGTFSPNAAFVHMDVSLPAGTHTIKLQWKTNKDATGAAIYAGAGPWPSAGIFSPTRLTVALFPTASNLVNPMGAMAQYNLPNSDGAGWTPIDATNLKITQTPAATTTYAFSGNADLWTANAGFNQDIGIFISGGIYGSGTLIAWKESGGFAGTFSPNAAYVETVQHLQAGSYTIWLAWKTNKQGAGSTIFAAAGPLSGTTNFSNTLLAGIQLSSP